MSTAPDRWAWSPLGQMLVNDKLLSTEQLNQALERQRKTRERLGQILIDMKLIDEDILLKYLGAQFRKDPITRQELGEIDPEVVKLVPEEVARQYGVIASQRSGRRLIVATADPLNVMAMDDLRRATGLEVDFRIGPAGAIQETIEKAYRKVTKVVSTEGLEDALKVDLGLNIGPATSALPEGVVDIKQLQTQADDPPVVRVVNYVLGRAALDGASDIHVEPHDDRTRVRYRIDGLLFDLLEIPRQLHLAVVSRIKIISRLDIAERRLPQDGSFSSRIHGQEFDFRVSTLPTLYGEKVVLRLLEKAAVVERYSIENLGFEQEQLELFLKGVRRPWGMVLITGPTGSGKSTTLHTALKLIKSPRKNIVTVEDPVEYRQPGIQQVQVKSEIGFDFARALRSILRQDPDIIMVGEIRDQETAQIAVKAALTGHLVLSTLHTNDAVSTLIRLVNIGVEPFLVASAVNVAAAQRLVRKICKDCKEPYRPSADELALFAPDPGPEVLYRGRGCKSCRNVGYAGRMALYEVFAIDSEVRRMLIDGADGDKIQRYAMGSGMVTLRKCGFRQAARGLTSLEEVLTVAADLD
ncbi:MAG TPA: ATPase, T2SS/T4P/T4SS family [Methylomirabilota bacterium]|jgi:type IV pilus assembly protein PilB|nr:ATPase, T2SS/T4P/T4SS family [Methylomirabilota bacterium]